MIIFKEISKYVVKDHAQKGQGKWKEQSVRDNLTIFLFNHLTIVSLFHIMIITNISKSTNSL
jgi:hypothetical protein